MGCLYLRAYNENPEQKYVIVKTKNEEELDNLLRKQIERERKSIQENYSFLIVVQKYTKMTP